MKNFTSLKKLGAAAVFSATWAMTGAAFASGPNQPDFDLLSGSGDLTVTIDGSAALDTASVKIIGLAPATYSPATNCDFAIPSCDTPDTISVPGDLPNIKWNADHVLTDVKALGGFLVYSAKATGGTVFSGTPSWSTWVSGPLVELSNISVDPATKTLFMDFRSKNFGSYVTPGPLTQKKFFVGQALTTNSTAAPNSLDIDNYTFTGDKATISATVTGLFFDNGANTGIANSPIIANSGLQVMGNALGVAASLQKSTFTGLDFGVLDIDAQVQAVPEPSTYAILGVGLATLAWRARRGRGTASTAEA
jgi:hypothetical protein